MALIVVGLFVYFSLKESSFLKYRHAALAILCASNFKMLVPAELKRDCPDGSSFLKVEP